MPSPPTVRGHIDLPLSVCPYVRPDKVCVVHNSKTVCTKNLKFHGCIIQGVSTCAPGYFNPAEICIYGFMGLDLVKKRHFLTKCELGHLYPIDTFPIY